jgi:hypothetical protein
MRIIGFSTDQPREWENFCAIFEKNFFSYRASSASFTFAASGLQSGSFWVIGEL